MKTAYHRLNLLHTASSIIYRIRQCTVIQASCVDARYTRIPAHTMTHVVTTRLVVQTLYMSQAVYDDAAMRCVDPEWRRPPDTTSETEPHITQTERLYLAVQRAVERALANPASLGSLLTNLASVRRTTAVGTDPLTADAVRKMVQRAAASIVVVGESMSGKSQWIEWLMRRLAPCPPDDTGAGYSTCGPSAPHRTRSVITHPYQSFREPASTWRPMLVDTPPARPTTAVECGVTAQLVAHAPPVLAVMVVCSVTAILQGSQLTCAAQFKNRAQIVAQYAADWLRVLESTTVVCAGSPVFVVLTHRDAIHHPPRHRLFKLFQMTIVRYLKWLTGRNVLVAITGVECTHAAHSTIHPLTTECGVRPDGAGRAALPKLVHQLRYLATDDAMQELV